jgi:disulfide bond formation protein DsbB
MANNMDFINALGLELKGNAFVGHCDDYHYSVIMNLNMVGQVVIRFVFSKPISQQTIQQINKSTKSLSRGDKFAQPQDTLLIPMPGRGRKTLDEYRILLQDRLTTLTSAFRQYQLVQHETCTVCHQGSETEEAKLKNFNGYFVPIHDSCADQLLVVVNTEIKNEQKRWYLLPVSMLLAIIGGVIGLIPMLVVLFISDYYIGILYALIPLAALYGYRLGKAPKNILMIFSIVIVTLALSIGFVFAFYQLIAIGMESTFEVMLADPAFAESFQSDLLTGVVFGIIGIIIAWRSISKTSSQKIDSVQALKNQ